VNSYFSFQYDPFKMRSISIGVQSLRKQVLVMLFLCLFRISIALGDTQVPTFGHNLTPNTDSLTAKQYTLGTYLVGYGVSDVLAVGTSPWLIVAYNMTNIGTKWTLFSETEHRPKVVVDGVFFKTLEYGLNWYHQTSTLLRATAGKALSPHYSMSLSIGHQYFFDELTPFSFRPPPLNGTKSTWNFGVLSEFKFCENYGAFLETALLGFNYPNRYAHLGVSLYRTWATSMLQIGFSRSIPFGPDQFVGGEPASYWESGGQRRLSVYYARRAPFHPEIKFQLYF